MGSVPVRRRARPLRKSCARPWSERSRSDMDIATFPGYLHSPCCSTGRPTEIVQRQVRRTGSVPWPIARLYNTKGSVFRTCRKPIDIREPPFADVPSGDEPLAHSIDLGVRASSFFVSKPCNRNGRGARRHDRRRRIVSTSNSAVPGSIPTLTQPPLLATSDQPTGVACPIPGSMKIVDHGPVRTRSTEFDTLPNAPYTGVSNSVEFCL